MCVLDGILEIKPYASTHFFDRSTARCQPVYSRSRSVACIYGSKRFSSFQLLRTSSSVTIGYNGWYTLGMKTAVSLPDEVFEAAERLARERGLTRSALYAQALGAFLEANEIDPLTEAINRVADRVDTRLDPGLKRLQRATLERHG